MWGLFGPITFTAKVRPDRESGTKREEESGLFYRFYNVNLVFDFIFTIITLLLCNVLTDAIQEKEFKRRRKLQNFMNRMKEDLRALNLGFGHNCDSKVMGILIQQEVGDGHPGEKRAAREDPLRIY